MLLVDLVRTATPSSRIEIEDGEGVRRVKRVEMMWWPYEVLLTDEALPHCGRRHVEWKWNVVVAVGRRGTASTSSTLSQNGRLP